MDFLDALESFKEHLAASGFQIAELRLARLERGMTPTINMKLVIDDPAPHSLQHSSPSSGMPRASSHPRSQVPVSEASLPHLTAPARRAVDDAVDDIIAPPKRPVAPHGTGGAHTPMAALHAAALQLADSRVLSPALTRSSDSPSPPSSPRGPPPPVGLPVLPPLPVSAPPATPLSTLPPQSSSVPASISAPPNGASALSDGGVRKRIPMSSTVRSGGRGRHACAECGQSFQYRSRLVRHVNFVHNGKRGRDCRECDQSFFYNADLRKHCQLVHRKERPWKCSVEGCTADFQVKSQLRRHLSMRHPDAQQPVSP